MRNFIAELNGHGALHIGGEHIANVEHEISIYQTPDGFTADGRVHAATSTIRRIEKAFGKSITLIVARVGPPPVRIRIRETAQAHADFEVDVSDLGRF